MTRKPAYLAFLFSIVFLSASALSYDPFVLGTNSIVLDGLNDYITVLDDSSLALTNVTIAAWINVTPGSASTTILSKDSSYKLEIDTNGKLKASLYAPSTWNSVTPTIALPSNEWIFITFTFTGSDLNLYVDGVLNQSVTPLSALSIASSTNDLYIGSAAGSSSFFNGSIDDLAVWDSALSQSDITTIYNSGSGISDLTQTYSTDLVGYWKFDEGSGNSASDSSGQGNDGTLSNEWMWADIYLSIGGHGVPTKAIPRLVSEDGAIRLYYNATAQYQACRVYDSSGFTACGNSLYTIRTISDACPSSSGSTLEMNLSGSDTYSFEIWKDSSSNQQSRPSVLLGGSLKVSSPSNFGKGEPHNFGSFNDNNYSIFQQIDLNSSIVHDADISKHRGLFYQLYKVSDCGLISSGSLNLVGAVNNLNPAISFDLSVTKPTDCSQGQTCQYVGELLFQEATHSGPLSGGALFEFTFERALGDLTLSESSANLGSVPAGVSVIRNVTLTNSGVAQFTGLSAHSNNTNLSVSLGQSSLGVNQSTILTINVTAPSDAINGSFNEVITINGTTSGTLKSVIYTLQFNFQSAFSASPSNVDFGSLQQDENKSSTIILSNSGLANVTNITVSTSATELSIDDEGPFDVAPSATKSLKLTLLTTSSMADGNYTESVTISHSGGNITIPVSYQLKKQLGALSFSPPSISFGTIERGESMTQNISIMNGGNAAVSGLSFTAPNEFSVSLSATSIPVNGSITGSVTVSVSSDADAGFKAESVTFKSAGVSTTFPVSYTVPSAPPAPKMDVAPATWDLGTVSPGTSDTKIFTTTVLSGDTKDITATISLETSIKNAISLSSSTLSIGGVNETPSVTATLTAPDTEGLYRGKIFFKFSYKGTILETISIPVTIEVKEDLVSLVSSAQGRYSSTQRGIDTLKAQAGLGKLSGEMTASLNEAETMMSEVNSILQQVTQSAQQGRSDQVKTLIGQINSKLSSADEIVRQIQMQSESSKKKTKRNLTPLFAGLGVLILIAALGLSLREGWIPIYKSKKAMAVFEKLHLAGFLKKPADMSPRTRLKPGKPLGKQVSKHPAAPDRKPEVPTPTMSPEKQAGLKKEWAEYYKRHPDYARYVRQQYRSYGNRRYK